MEKKFIVSEVLTWAWQETRNNFGILIPGALIYFALYSLNFVTRFGLRIVFEHSGTELKIIYYLLVAGITVVFMYLTLALHLGMYKTALKIRDNENVVFTNIFSYFLNFKILFFALVAGIIVVTIVAFGFVFLFVPGVYFALMFSQYIYCIIEFEMNPFAAIGESKKITDIVGVKSELFVLFLVLFAINVAGLLVCGVGLLVTVPITWMASAYVFRSLVPKLGKAQPTTATDAPGTSNL